MANPTVYSGAQFGLKAELTNTGLYIGSISWDKSSEQATVPDHIGTTVGVSIYNPTCEVTCDGVIASRSNGLVGAIGSVLVLENGTFNGRVRNSEGLGATLASGAGIIVTGNNISPTGTGFETGSISGSFWPGVAAGTVYNPT